MIVLKNEEKPGPGIFPASWMNEDLFKKYLDLRLGKTKVDPKAKLLAERDNLLNAIETYSAAIAKAGEELSDLQTEIPFLEQMARQRIEAFSADAEEFAEDAERWMDVAIVLDKKMIVGITKPIHIQYNGETRDFGSYCVGLHIDGTNGIMEAFPANGLKSTETHPHLDAKGRATRRSFVEALPAILAAKQYGAAFSACLEYMETFEPDEFPDAKAVFKKFHLVENKNRKNEPERSFDSTETLVKKYLLLCGCGIHAEKLEKAKSGVQKKMSGYVEKRRLLGTALDTLADVNRAITDGTKPPETAEEIKLRKEFASLANIPELEKITEISTSSIAFLTKVITCQGAKLGIYKVTLSSNGSVRMFNQTRTVTGCNHPHVNSGGVPCLGNIQSTMGDLLNSREFGLAIPLAIEFLKSYSNVTGFTPYIEIDNWR